MYNDSMLKDLSQTFSLSSDTIRIKRLSLLAPLTLFAVSLVGRSLALCQPWPLPALFIIRFRRFDGGVYESSLLSSILFFTYLKYSGRILLRLRLIIPLTKSPFPTSNPNRASVYSKLT
jgi:hypothetical protein